MKKPLKITLTISITIVMLLGFALPLNPAGNWYQQFMPNIGGRSILDITFLDSLTGYSITTISADTSYILKTTDSGDSWSINHRAASSIFRRIQFINNDTGYVGGQHLIKTTNGGSNWFLVYPSLFAEDIYFINSNTAWYADPNSLVGGVFFTSNGGANWQQQLNAGSNNPEHIYMYNARIGFIDGPGLVKTTNGGLNWILIPGAGNFLDIFFTDSLTGWKCNLDMKKTTNGGLNWISQVLPGGGIILDNSMISFSNLNSDTIWGTGGTAFYGSGQFRGILYRTTNGGGQWLFQVPDTSIHSGTYREIQFINRLSGWAYWPVGGVHTTNGGDTQWLTGIKQISTEIPSDYELFQNYPNPFNPKTVIKYQILEYSGVKLSVFDVTGKHIIDLTDQKQSAGTYAVDFSGNGYSSGVYFYQLTVTSGKEVFTETKRMLIIK